MSVVFKVGDEGRTVGGQHYKVIATDVQGLAKGRSLVAVIEGYSYCLHSDGTENNGNGAGFAYNLLPPTRYVYINVFNYVTGPDTSVHSVVYSTEAEAMRVAGVPVAHENRKIYHAIACRVELKQS